MTLLLDSSALRAVAIRESPGYQAVTELVELAGDDLEPVCAAHHAYLDARGGLTKPLLDVLNDWMRRADIPLARLPEKQQAAVAALLRLGNLEVGQAHTAMLAAELDAVIATFVPEAYLDVVHPRRLRDLGDAGHDIAGWPVD